MRRKEREREARACYSTSYHPPAICNLACHLLLNINIWTLSIAAAALANSQLLLQWSVYRGEKSKIKRRQFVLKNVHGAMILHSWPSVRKNSVSQTRVIGKTHWGYSQFLFDDDDFQSHTKKVFFLL